MSLTAVYMAVCDVSSEHDCTTCTQWGFSRLLRWRLHRLCAMRVTGRGASSPLFRSAQSGHRGRRTTPLARAACVRARTKQAFAVGSPLLLADDHHLGPCVRVQKDFGDTPAVGGGGGRRSTGCSGPVAQGDSNARQTATAKAAAASRTRTPSRAPMAMPMAMMKKSRNAVQRKCTTKQNRRPQCGEDSTDEHAKQQSS